MFNFFSKKPTVPARMSFSTDIHCHVLPGVDDGSPDVDTSLAIIGRMAELGINRIIASPHVTQDTFENTPQTLDAALGTLSRAMADAGTPVAIARSAEYRLDEYFQSQLAAGAIATLPGNHIIVENAFIQEPWNLEAILFDLKVRGYIPILAHPERYLYYHSNRRKRYDELRQAGTLFQVNMLSLAGYYGKPEREVALHLLDKGYIDFLGTDIHSMRHVEAIADFLASRDYARIAPKLNPRNDSL